MDTNINEYDSQAEARQQLFSKGQILPHEYVEKPAMRSILPNLEGAQVLLLGCGTAEEYDLVKEFGARAVTGIDNSPESIRLAQESHQDGKFVCADMHKIPFGNEEFDVVYSSLAVHYSKDLYKLYAEVARVLKPNGIFQFSSTHPMRWAAEDVELEGRKVRIMGYTVDDGRVKRYGEYSTYHHRNWDFTTGGNFNFYVAPPSLHFAALRKNNFRVDEFIETRAVEVCREVDEEYYDRYSHFPQFVVFQARLSEKG